MEEDSIEISIVRAEGISTLTQSIGCYVQIDGRLHDVITPLNADNQENEVVVPTNGLLRLIVKNMGCASEVLGSVSFELKILPTEGFQWLPLFCSMAKDQIFELPEEVDKAKILILINASKKESIEYNETEASKTNNKIVLTEIQEFLHKEKSRYELEVCKMEKMYKGTVEALKIENEKCKKNMKKYLLLFEDVAKELKGTKMLLLEERKMRNEVEEKIGKVTQEYEENLKRANFREDGLLRNLEEKETEISELNGMVSQMKSAIRSLEYEKQQIVDVVDEYKTELTLSNITRLNQELALVKGLLEESEAQRHKLQQFLQEVPETPSKLSTFLSPISLGSSIFRENSDELSENKQIIEEFTKTYQEFSLKGLTDSLVEKEKNKDSSLTMKNMNSFRNFQEIKQDDGNKTHRRGVTVGMENVTDENEEVATVRGLKSPAENSFMKNKTGGRNLVIQSSTTPLRERNSNKRFVRKAVFK